MELVDRTLATAAENLALDEALLEEAESSPNPREFLRLWESPHTMVVRNSRHELEVNQAACQADGVPVLRRSSGGCAVLAGPGCLMYAVVLSYELRPRLRMLDAAHEFVLETILAGLRPLVPTAVRRGTSDLALADSARGELKFSGNSLRCRRRALLYHGTLLYDFPLEQIGRYLTMPPREPEYRQGRQHGEFVTNLPLRQSELRAALTTAWQATPRHDWPEALVRELVARPR